MRVTRVFLFPALLLVLYGILFAVMPDSFFLALKNTGNIFLRIFIPLCVVFVLMTLLNLFLKPEQIIRFLAKGAGIKGFLLPAAAGVISVGPIYAWYPLLKDLKVKGAGNFSIAVFLYNRAIKPFLFPVMIAYFGWVYAVIVTVLTLLGSVAVGFLTSMFAKE